MMLLVIDSYNAGSSNTISTAESTLFRKLHNSSFKAIVMCFEITEASSQDISLRMQGYVAGIKSCVVGTGMDITDHLSIL